MCIRDRNRVNSSNTGKNVKTGVGSSATILATLAAAVGGLFASKKRKNEEMCIRDRSNTARNIHGNWKILLMQKPLEQMHKKPTPTEIQHDGGYLTGKVGWDYKSGIGGIQWNTVADTDTPAKDVTVKASYLSDLSLIHI